LFFVYEYQSDFTDYFQKLKGGDRGMRPTIFFQRPGNMRYRLK
jgi:hypothetical protein